MTNYEIGQELVERYKAVAARLAEVVGDRTLPEANEVRRETDVPPGYTDEDIDKFQTILGELGFGRGSDLSPEEAGMQEGYTALMQGGLERKIDSEWQSVENGSVSPGAIIQTASPYRLINDIERKSALRKGIILPDEATELDLAIGIAKRRLGENAHSEPLAVEFEYDPSVGLEDFVFDKDNKGAQKPTVVEVGIKDGAPVYVMQVLRAFNEDGKYKQPSTMDLAMLSAELIRKMTSEYPSFMANVGSATYPSLDVAPRGNAIFAKEGVPTVLGDIKYGTRTLAYVDDSPETKPNAANTLSEVDRLTKMAASL